MDDRSDVTAQLGRRPRAFRRVVVRCPWGKPAGTEQSAYDAAGDPFPTTYYLTCESLVAAVSRIEAAGGVERWSDSVHRDPALAESLRDATRRQREIRRALAAGQAGSDGGASLGSGIGGSHNPQRLKCLHAHVAFGLANPGYAVSDGVLAEIGEIWPTSCCFPTDA
jgi:uncharacterized protein